MTINLEKTESESASRLTKQTLEAIDKWIIKYPPDQKQSAVLFALRAAQDQNGGWLTVALMNEVADYLDMPPIAVYEVATFYKMFDLEPVGRHKIYLCTSISCMLAGSDAIGAHLQKRLGINFDQTTADGKFTLKRAECLAACIGAPMMQINCDYHENLTPEKVDHLLAELE